MDSTNQYTSQIKMEDSDYAAVKVGAPLPNHYDPSAMPQGSSVLIRDNNINGLGVRAAFKNIFVDVGATKERGSAMLLPGIMTRQRRFRKRSGMERETTSS